MLRSKTPRAFNKNQLTFSQSNTLKGGQVVSVSLVTGCPRISSQVYFTHLLSTGTKLLLTWKKKRGWVRCSNTTATHQPRTVTCDEGEINGLKCFVLFYRLLLEGNWKYCNSDSFRPCKHVKTELDHWPRWCALCCTWWKYSWSGHTTHSSGRVQSDTRNPGNRETVSTMCLCVCTHTDTVGDVSVRVCVCVFTSEQLVLQTIRSHVMMCSPVSGSVVGLQ